MKGMTTQSVPPMSNCDYQISVDINNRAWKCVTAIEYQELKLASEARAKADLDSVINGGWMILFAPIGVIIIVWIIYRIVRIFKK